MCGIFGIIFHNKDIIPDKYKLHETACLMKHRGPDNTGIFVDNGIGLVHTRLSLLDLSAKGNQPFWDKEKRYCIVYNGEIYNFREIRNELEQKGVKFFTNTDTEVLLECIINNGMEATLQKIEGMFAFGLYDRQTNDLIVVRDRFGIKPLFIYDKDDIFIFASTPNAMKPWVRIEPDNFTLSSFLFGHAGPSKGHTFFKHIKSLPPGSIVKISQGSYPDYRKFFSVVDFWSPACSEEIRKLPYDKLIDKVEYLLFESVKKQLFADAPVGTLCSGGIDSALVTAMAHKIHNNVAIFHADVVGGASEYEIARRLAKHLKLDLIAVKVYRDDFIDRMPEVIEHFGYPFNVIPSSVPFLMVSKLVRANDVKAVLTGEGSDECFLGYSYLVPNVQRFFKKPLRTAKELIKFFMRNNKINYCKFIMGFSPYFGAYSKQRMKFAHLIMGLHNRFEVDLETDEICKHILNSHNNGNSFEYTQSLDLFNYNLRVLLHRNDTLGMAASIESRFPYLDSNLVKTAINLPYNMKIRFSPFSLNKEHYFFTEKWILRKVAERYLPKELSRIPKKTFNDNTYDYLKIPTDFLKRSWIIDLFELSSQEANYLIENAPHNLKLKLLHLDIWARIHLYNQKTEMVINNLRKYLTFINT